MFDYLVPIADTWVPQIAGLLQCTNSTKAKEMIQSVLEIVPAVDKAINARNRCATVFLLGMVADFEMQFYPDLNDDVRPMFKDRAKTLGPLVKRLNECASWQELIKYMGISQTVMKEKVPIVQT